jgi:tRNA(fMet)-specific endonuclease VapC
VNRMLIDTNIYSNALRGQPAVVDTLRRASHIGIASISLGELLSGFAGGAHEHDNRQQLAEFLDAPRVAIYAVTEHTAEFYASVLQGLRQAGTPIPTNDIWIAAVALENGLKLYSLDHHFAAVPGLVRVPEGQPSVP